MGSAAVMAIACVWGTNSYAQSDADAVKAAVAAYTAAVDSLDPAKMEALWVHDDTVMDIEPGSRTIAVGWDAVKKFIDGNFLVFAELKNVLADGPHVQIKGDLARSMGIAMVTYKLKNGTAASVNVFLSHVSKSMTELGCSSRNSSRRFRSRRLTPPNSAALATLGAPVFRCFPDAPDGRRPVGRGRERQRRGRDGSWLR